MASINPRPHGPTLVYALVGILLALVIYHMMAGKRR